MPLVPLVPAAPQLAPPVLGAAVLHPNPVVDPDSIIMLQPPVIHLPAAGNVNDQLDLLNTQMKTFVDQVNSQLPALMDQRLKTHLALGGGLRGPLHLDDPFNNFRLDNICPFRKNNWTAALHTTITTLMSHLSARRLTT